jgi:integrase
MIFGTLRNGGFSLAAHLKGVMDRMGHAQIQTTQKYLHTLPDTDQKNLDALTRMTSRSDRVS